MANTERLEAVSPNRVLTNSTPVFSFSYVQQRGSFALVAGSRLGFLPQGVRPAKILIYSVGLNQYWNGAAYQAAPPIPADFVDLTEVEVQGSYFYNYTAPAGLVRGVPDTLLIQASGYADGDAALPFAERFPIIKATQAVAVEYDFKDIPVADAAFAAGDIVDTMGELLSVLKLVHYNTQEVNDLNKRLIHYKNDGQTPGLSFSLKDAQGNLSAREVFKKEQV